MKNRPANFLERRANLNRSGCRSDHYLLAGLRDALDSGLYPAYGKRNFFRCQASPTVALAVKNFLHGFLRLRAQDDGNLTLEFTNRRLWCATDACRSRGRLRLASSPGRGLGFHSQGCGRAIRCGQSPVQPRVRPVIGSFVVSPVIRRGRATTEVPIVDCAAPDHRAPFEAAIGTPGCQLSRGKSSCTRPRPLPCAEGSLCSVDQAPSTPSAGLPQCPGRAWCRWIESVSRECVGVRVARRSGRAGSARPCAPTMESGRRRQTCRGPGRTRGRISLRRGRATVPIRGW